MMHEWQANITRRLQTEESLGGDARVHLTDDLEIIEPTPIPCPFEIVIDTREQSPYAFLNMRANAKDRGARFVVATRRLCLPNGDYSIFGYPQVAVERKSKADLFGSVAKRDNFEGRLERMAELDCAYVVVEAEWSEVLSNPPRHSKLNPKALFRTLLAWQQRYRGVHWLGMPGRDAAEATTFRILERFWLNKERERKQIESVPDDTDINAINA